MFFSVGYDRFAHANYMFWHDTFVLCACMIIFCNDDWFVGENPLSHLDIFFPSSSSSGYRLVSLNIPVIRWVKSPTVEGHGKAQAEVVDGSICLEILVDFRGSWWSFCCPPTGRSAASHRTGGVRHEVKKCKKLVLWPRGNVWIFGEEISCFLWSKVQWLPMEHSAQWTMKLLILSGQ